MPEARNSTRLFYALSIAWQLGFLIAVPLAGFVALGVWFDRHFSFSPAGILLGAGIGFFVSTYETYHTIIPLISNK